MHYSTGVPEGVEIRGKLSAGYANILTPQALAFIAKLARKFEGRRRELLDLRKRRQIEFDGGKRPDFPSAIKHIREGDWTVAPAPHDLLDRRVEITGPTDRKMVINALYFFHNAKTLLANGSGPYFYLPKMENYLEARLWNDIFVVAQRELGVPQGTIKATALIETVLAAFEMDEILYEMREHCVGLNIGRWDYIFSCIKKFHANKDFCLADRAEVTMTAPFMRAYALLLIKTCHNRKAFAMGGMAAQIPIKNDPAANKAALDKVRADKVREATDGCDGTWVAHPGLVSIAKAVFDEHMPGPNQVCRERNDVRITARDLLDFQPEKPITEAGLRNNISVGIQYIGAWLAGNGCVPVYNLMEDAATAEISRSQIWQWIRSPKGVLDDGRKVSRELVRKFLPEELARVRTLLSEDAWKAGRYEEAARLFDEITVGDEYVDFLTLSGYELLMRDAPSPVPA
jgi:malate synthase